MDASEINRMLADRMEEVCQYLLPNGKRTGNKWECGSISGEAGKSFSVTVSGHATGRFNDFADDTSKGGTPLFLWTKVRNVSFVQAIKDAADWLGVQPSAYGAKKVYSKTFAKPGKASIKLAESNSPAMDYMVVTRKIDPTVVVNAKICDSEDGTEIIFPYIEFDAESGTNVCVHRKFMKIDRPDGRKEMHSTKGTKRCLFGKHMVSDDVRELVCCEGETDSLSWQSWGIPAVSMPNGVSDLSWIELDWDWLARFESIYISTDMDEPGRKAATEICKRLGLHRCKIVSLTCKDANDCLVGGVTRDEMLKFLADAKLIELDEIKKPDDFRKEVMDFYSSDPSEQGLMTPWTPDLPFRIRRGEFTIMSGFSGSGKTALLNQLMVSLITQGCRVMDASLEIRPAMTLYYMTRCALGRKHSEGPDVEACVAWLNESMFFLDCIGTVTVDRLMQAMEYARKRHGIDIFVIDSLFKCGLAPEDYAGQRSFADRITTFCNNTGAHVILVAHSRKTNNGNELSVPSKADVAGSSDISNAAFNVLIAWRNKMKSRKLAEARHRNDFEEIDKWMGEPDGKILLDKQRFGEGEECEVYTFFDKDSCQFSTTSGRKISYFELK